MRAMSKRRQFENNPKSNDNSLTKKKKELGQPKLKTNQSYSHTMLCFAQIFVMINSTKLVMLIKIIGPNFPQDFFLTSQIFLPSL